MLILPATCLETTNNIRQHPQESVRRVRGLAQRRTPLRGPCLLRLGAPTRGICLEPMPLSKIPLWNIRCRNTVVMSHPSQQLARWKTCDTRARTLTL